MRSPLKDKNGFACIDAIHALLPAGSPLKTFLFFSGNLELALSHYGHQVTAYTNKYVTFEFWKCAARDPINIIQKAGDIEEEEMRKTFNLGIGFCLIVPPDVDVNTGDLRSWTIGTTK